jgi:spore maturation protein CgeB
MSPGGLLIVANPAPTEVGAHLIAAARSLDLEAFVCDTREAFAGPWLAQKASWWLRGHRPARLEAFSQRAVREVRERRPALVLTTGLAPLTREALAAIGAVGATRLNFLTDDPWNAVHHAPWFRRALPTYDIVFSPRQANLDDLRRAGVARVEYVPFAYDPATHFYEPASTAEARARHQSDVLLAGGADPERVALVTPLIEAGLRVALHGGYWDRFDATRAHARGFLDAGALRQATAEARICLGLVRRANRDGHSMRTFEVPAMGGCLLAEDTPDHRRLFGSEDDAVLYFHDSAGAVAKARWLVGHPEERDRLAARARALVTAGGHTYADRLRTMIEVAA